MLGRQPWSLRQNVRLIRVGKAKAIDCFGGGNALAT